MRINPINLTQSNIRPVQSTFGKRVKIASSEDSNSEWGGIEGVLSNGKRFHCYAMSGTQFSVTIMNRTGQKLIRHYSGDTNQYPQRLVRIQPPQDQSGFIIQPGMPNPYIKEYKPPKNTRRLINMIVRLLTAQKYPENTGQPKLLSEVLPVSVVPPLVGRLLEDRDIMGNVNIKLTTTGQNNYQLLWGNQVTQKGAILAVEVDPRTGKVSSRQNYKVRAVGEASELIEQPSQKERPFGKKKHFRVLKALLKRLPKTYIDPSQN